MFSRKHETQKKIYAEGTDELDRRLGEHLKGHEKQHQREAVFCILASAVVVGLLLLTWLTVLSRLRHWRTAQLRSFDRLAHGKEELRNGHSLLEMRVQERTAELRKASLEVQASEARTAAAQLLETNCRLEAATARANELAVRAESANGAKSEFLASMSHEVRDDQNYWQQVESYISKRTDARFSHGYCPDCFKKAMQEIEASDGTAA